MCNKKFEKLKQQIRNGEKNFINENINNIEINNEIKNLQIKNFLIENIIVKNSIKYSWIENSEIKVSDFSGIIIEESSLYNCKLERCNFEDSRILGFDQETWGSLYVESCNFKNTIVRANLEIDGCYKNCCFENAYFGCRDIDAEFFNCNLEGILVEGSFTGTFYDVNLRKSKLCNLAMPIFENCDLRDAKISGMLHEMDKTNFKNTKLSNISIENLDDEVIINLPETDFSESCFSNIICENSNLEKCNLEKCNFEYVNMANSNLKGANLKNSTFKKTNLTNADLSFTDLENIDFKDSILDNVKVLEKDFKFIKKFVKKEDVQLI